MCHPIIKVPRKVEATQHQSPERARRSFDIDQLIHSDRAIYPTPPIMHDTAQFPAMPTHVGGLVLEIDQYAAIVPIASGNTTPEFRSVFSIGHRDDFSCLPVVRRRPMEIKSHIQTSRLWSINVVADRGLIRSPS